MSDDGGGANTDTPQTDDRPGDEHTATMSQSITSRLRWVWHTDHAAVSMVRELALSVAIVLVIALILFAASGVWPPLVAVESDSMEPQIMTGDLVFIVEPDRYAATGAIDGTGVVPADIAKTHGHESFDGPGDVIVFAPNGDDDVTPVIHRAHLWVTEGENWYDRADSALIGEADDCDELNNCPAPHDGFITHGDNNQRYDQVQSQSTPVKGDWVIARGHIRVPWVGHVRLWLTELVGVALPPWGTGISF